MEKKLTYSKIVKTALFLGLFAFASCKKGSSSVQSSDAVTENDAAQVTTDAVMPSTGGVANQSVTTTSLALSLPYLCGAAKDSTITVASLAGITPVYTFTFSWNYTLNCNGTVPANISYNFMGKGSYAGTYITASHTGKGQFILTNLTDSTAYTLNGSYVRNGTFASRFVRPHAFTSVITITANNIFVSKLTREITGGTGTVSIAATSASGKNYNFAGTITFLGNKKANLVLNSGVSYPIQWL